MDYLFSGAGNGIKRPVSVILERTVIYDTDRERFRELVQQLTGMATSPPTSAPKPVISRLQHYAPPPLHPGSYPGVLLQQSSILPPSAFACSSTEEMGFMPVDDFSATESVLQYYSPLSISPTPALSSKDPLWPTLMEFETPGTVAMRLWIESLLADEEASTAGFGTADQGLTSTQRALPSPGELVISPIFGFSCQDCKRGSSQCICRQRA